MHAFDNFMLSARFLIIDDEPVSASAVEISLAAAGHEEIMVVNDPCEATKAYLEYQPDIILLDVTMPVMNGFEVLEQIRQTMAPDDYLPVIIITADNQETTKRRALEGGAQDFLTKPFGATELRLRVRNLLHTRFLHLGLREQNRRLDERVLERTKELEAAMEELRQAQRQAVGEARLHAFSEMAAGVVHDFNNVLMILMSLADVIERDSPLPADSMAAQHLDSMQKILLEAAQMISRLHYFCRPRHEDDLLTDADLKKIVEEAVVLAKPKWHSSARAEGREIHMSATLQRLAPFPCNAVEMREAVLHLILNAIDAMPAGGTLTVTLESTEGGVALAVGDTGIGMTEEVRARCLDPYFSTKSASAAGLGLPMVHGIVRRHGGKLEINTQPGAGAHFRISLPHENKAMPMMLGRSHLSKPLRILLAEDDDRLRQLISLQMESMGHIVIGAANGVEAVEKLKSAPIDVILTDLSMPRLNGLGLVESAQNYNAQIPIIMLTGFAAMLLPDGQTPKGVDLLLTKPVTRDNLAAAIAQVAA
jgi:CheY-like chemotaxis protein